MPGAFFHAAYETAFGAGEVCWRESAGGIKIIRVFLPARRGGALAAARVAYPGIARGEHQAVFPIIRTCIARTAGRAAAFSSGLLDWDVCGPFQRRVLREEARVPRGRVTTYGRLAARIGAAGAARAVGHALAENPFPLLIPCHRIVRADGGLGGFQAGLAMKRRLLELEGVALLPNGKARLRDAGFGREVSGREVEHEP